MNENEMLEIVLSYDGMVEMRQTGRLEKFYSVARRLNGRIIFVYIENKRITDVKFHDREWSSLKNLDQFKLILLRKIRNKYKDRLAKPGMYIVLVDKL